MTTKTNSYVRTTLMAAIIGATGFASAAVIGTDNAGTAAYNDGLQTGDDGSASGDAFGAWSLTSDGFGSFAGATVEDSTNGDLNTNINTGGRAWGLFADNNVFDSFSRASRGLNGVLNVGQSFSAQLKVNFRGGLKGIDVTGVGSTLFTLVVGNIGAGDDYSVVNAATGNGSLGSDYSSDTIFDIVLTQTSAVAGEWTVTRSGGLSSVSSGTYTGAVDGFELFAQAVGGGAENNLWANNIAVVPAPGISLVLAAGTLGFVRRRRV